jgi:hypothetical protein
MGKEKEEGRKNVSTEKLATSLDYRLFSCAWKFSLIFYETLKILMSYVKSTVYRPFSMIYCRDDDFSSHLISASV